VKIWSKKKDNDYKSNEKKLPCIVGGFSVEFLYLYAFHIERVGLLLVIFKSVAFCED